MKLILKHIPLHLTLLLVLTLPLAARDVTVYRTILGTYDTFQEAQSAKRGQQDVIEQGDQFILVDGWFKRFEEALPTEAPRDPKQAWRHVYAVDVDDTNARGRGLAVERLLPEQAKDLHSDYIAQARDINVLIRAATDAINAADARKKEPGATAADVLNLLGRSEVPLIAIAETSNSTETVLFARMELARLYYLQGQTESRRRLPNVKQRQIKEMTGIEEIAYQSALDQLESARAYPKGSPEREEALYLIAVTRYGMVHHGHEVHQYKNAGIALDDYLQEYSYKPRAMELRVKRQDITLELARRGEAEFEDVIEQGSAFLAKYPYAPSKELAHTHLLIAEAVMEGQRDYQQVKDLTQYIIGEYARNRNADEVMGSVLRLQAYAEYFLQDYEAAVQTWNMFLAGGYSKPEYNFYYRIDEITAEAHYWRGKNSEHLGRKDDALADYRYIIQEFDGIIYVDYAQNAIDRLTKTLLERLNINFEDLE